MPLLFLFIFTQNDPFGLPNFIYRIPKLHLWKLELTNLAIRKD